MAALTDNSIKDTYIDLLQVSNSNSGIDGTRRNISDGEGTNAPITLSTSAAAFTGIADFTGGSPLFSNNSIPLAAVDLSDSDTIEGAIAMASGASLTFTSNSTLNLTDGTLTLANDQIPVAKIDQSGADTISGARTFTSAATFQATVDLTASTLVLQNDQIPLAKVDLSDNDTITGALTVASGASMDYASGASLTLDQDATFNALQVGHFQEQQSAGTDGGALTASAWRTRALNATVLNNISGASLGSSQITLPKGRYKVLGYAVGNRVNGHKARLFNSTASAVLLLGSSALSNSGTEMNVTTHLHGEFTLTTASTLELQHRCETTRATDGRGASTNTSASEIYSDVLFTRVGA